MWSLIKLLFFSYLTAIFLMKRARSKHNMAGGGERVAHVNPPPGFGPSVEAYFLVHVRSPHLSTIPFVLVSNFSPIVPLVERDY